MMLKIEKNYKSALKQLINLLIGFIRKTSAGCYVYDQIIKDAMGRTHKVVYKRLNLIFSIPNALSKDRVDTFSIKEPETLGWRIDEIPQDSVFWDIGANIGIYSIYAAMNRNCSVFAFEPSVFNLELLARNIHLNSLSDKICIVPLALNDHLGQCTFNMTTTSWGGALSTFGQSFDQNRQPLRTIFEYQTIGLSISDAVSILKIPLPDYIKIDVDGIEHLILRGGSEILTKVKGVLTEINDNFTAQAEESASHLTEAGLVLQKKCNLGVPYMFNQIWSRSE